MNMRVPALLCECHAVDPIIDVGIDQRVEFLEQVASVFAASGTSQDCQGFCRMLVHEICAVPHLQR